VTGEHVVLLDTAGRAVGTAPKAQVHHAHTPLHLAFSLYVFSSGGELLLTRRATAKATFPGVWTNTVCGHPGPGEPVGAAATRRALQELGLDVVAPRLVLPRFSYRAEMGGVVEHELCPVLVATVPPDAVPAPDPAEVDRTRWERWPDVVAGVRTGGLTLSPWAREQVAELARLGPDPARWPAADPALLPPAARAAQAGTDEPRTDEPGTDQPGTDQPGTGRPGTA
jgi:isopentenyl-diphosphate delta-isomerase